MKHVPRLKKHHAEMQFIFPTIAAMAWGGEGEVPLERYFSEKLLRRVVDLPVSIGKMEERFYIGRTNSRATMSLGQKHGGVPGPLFSKPFYVWDSGRASMEHVERAVINSRSRSVVDEEEYFSEHVIVPGKTYHGPFVARERFVNDILILGNESRPAKSLGKLFNGHFPWTRERERVIVDSIDRILSPATDEVFRKEFMDDVLRTFLAREMRADLRRKVITYFTEE